MSNLIESILSEDFVSASELFESRMQQIAEHKLLEAKKQIQAEGMVGMGMSRKEMKDREEAGYVPAHYTPEKGGLGLSDYDKGKEDIKKRLQNKLKKKLKESDADWDEFSKNYQRKKDLEAKRKEFAKKRPDVIAKHIAGKAAEKIGYGIGKTGRTLVGGVASGLASLYEE